MPCRGCTTHAPLLCPSLPLFLFLGTCIYAIRFPIPLFSPGDCYRYQPRPIALHTCCDWRYTTPHAHNNASAATISAPSYLLPGFPAPALYVYAFGRTVLEAIPQTLHRRATAAPGGITCSGRNAGFTRHSAPIRTACYAPANVSTMPPSTRHAAAIAPAYTRITPPLPYLGVTTLPDSDSPRVLAAACATNALRLLSRRHNAHVRDKRLTLCRTHGHRRGVRRSSSGRSTSPVALPSPP